jgi:hypothetical protein
LQKIADCLTHGALHIESGMWINIPETTDPKAPATVVRQSTIAHGDSLLAQSTFITEVAGGPSLTRWIHYVQRVILDFPPKPNNPNHPLASHFCGHSR